MTSPAELPEVVTRKVSLGEHLPLIVKRINLCRRVRNGAVVMGTPPDDRSPYQVATSAAARTWLVLDRSLALRFPEPTPLRDVLAAIRRDTGEGHERGHDLAIRVDEASLQEAETTQDMKVSIELERAPFCTSLALLLRQLGLCFFVDDVGVVVIENGYSHEMDMADVADGYRAHAWVESLKIENNEPEPGGFR